MARGIRQDPGVKAAVMAALMTGQGGGSIAAQYSLNESTVKNWKREINRGLTGLTPKKEADPGGASEAGAGDDYSDLLANYLRENLTTLAEQQKHFRNPKWLERQPASDLAVLHGVSADKAIRILEAAERARRDDKGA